MNIGIIGTGSMGSGLGKIWAHKSHKVMLSYKRNPKKLQTLAESIGSGTLGTGQRCPASLRGPALDVLGIRLYIGLKLLCR